MKSITPFLVFLAGASAALAQSAGTFTAIAAMTARKATHSATLLFNGKVLIAGGNGLTAFNVPSATAELYDPSTGTFTPTGNMTTARQQHTATLLADGRVLIAGGRTASNGAFVTSAELYDPSTETFTATGSRTSVTAGWGTATLLADGKVLITGVPNAEVYDPATGTFTVTGAYAGAGPRFLMTASLLTDNRVLVTGGGTSAGFSELYDPVTNTFSATGVMAGWENVNTATGLTNGKVLFVGNYENDGYPAGAELYDPTAGTFKSIGPTPGSHEFSSAALLPDGTVLIAGGQLPGGNGLAETDVYSPATGSFTAATSMTTARHEHTATLLPDGTVLIAGGYSAWPYPTSSAEVYSPPVLMPAPVLGQGAILHAGTHQVVSPDHPAAAGEALEIYLTGLIDGSVIPPQVAIGGRMAQVLFFGNAPGLPGVNQVNVGVPDSIAAGPAVPVRFTYLTRPSNAVTIAVEGDVK